MEDDCILYSMLYIYYIYYHLAGLRAADLRSLSYCIRNSIAEYIWIYYSMLLSNTSDLSYFVRLWKCTIQYKALYPIFDGRSSAPCSTILLNTMNPDNL